MAVHFSLPEQADSWSRINHALMAKRAGYGTETLEALWASGNLAVHEMATDEGPFGYLVLTRFDLGLGAFLQVMWCEVRPCKALRSELGWLEQAAKYLQEVAILSGCREVRIGIAEDHPSPSWKRRLQNVGFTPRVTELGISVAN